MVVFMSLNIQFFRHAILLIALALLGTGCAKKYQKMTLPPLKKAHFEQKKDNVTLKIRQLNERELKSIDSRGLGSYKIGSVPFNKKHNKRARRKYVQVLYGTLINETKHPIIFNRKSISLPVLQPHKAYGFSNKRMIAGFLSGVCGLITTGCGIALLTTSTAGGGFYMANGLVVAAAASNINLPFGTFFTILGIDLVFAGFALGAREVAYENYLKAFAKDTMLSDAGCTLLPDNYTSWLMVVRSHKYQRKFTFNCAAGDGSTVEFDVQMPQREAF